MGSPRIISRIRLAALAVLLGMGLGAFVAGGMEPARGAEPIRLHPDNPRYFLFRGAPAVLITSGEHYGAVLNLDFDYLPYLDELARGGFNLTRTFSGAYREIPGSFKIRGNTLAPAPGRYISPWARSAIPGYFDGGAKFDLRVWDEAYFRRLRDFVAEAGKRGIVVELVLFCPMYEDGLWKACPMNAANNVNGIGDVPRDRVYTLEHPELLEAQAALTRKIAAELREFDNLYYEICNEPYFGGVTIEWQRRIAETIAAAEGDLPARHLIAQNIANGSTRVEDPHPAVSILNFHYSSPPESVALNLRLGRAIGFDETGFKGTGDRPYRVEGWDFIIAGGAVYSNLDYSFTPDREDGSAEPDAPGGGGPALRKQLRILKDFIHGLDFIRMAPDGKTVKGGVPQWMSARALSRPGKEYAIYLRRRDGSGPFSARWTGLVEPEFTETYTFHSVSNDGVRLWVGDRLIIDNWTDHATGEDRGAIPLEAGKKVAIKMEYFQGGGAAVARLAWSSPSRKREIIPERRLFLPDGSKRGLKAEYFEDRRLEKRGLERVDPGIDFDWGSSSPFAPEPRAGKVRIDLELDLPAGAYRAEWVDPLTGEVERAESFEHPGGARALASPPIGEDIALRIRG